MKKIINSILFLFAITIFFTSNVFAGDAIPGVGVGVGRNPNGGIINATTDNNGKFSFSNLEVGKYDLTISYNEIIKKVSQTEKNKASEKNSYEITLVLDGAGVTVKDSKTPSKLLITNKTGVIGFSIPEGGANVSGTLTYEVVSPREQPSGNSDKKPGTSEIIMSVDRKSLDFGKVAVGETSTQTIIITNTGSSGEPLIIKNEYGISQPGIKIAISQVFSVSPAGIFTIAPGKSQTFTVTFSPTKAGILNQTIIFTNNSTNLPNSYKVPSSGQSTGKGR